MLSMVLIALAAPAVVAAMPPPSPSPAHCRGSGVTYAGKGKPVTSPRKLGELPPARHYLAVVRQVEGCPEPAVIRSGIGRR
jgi:hypothetical protein